ncbi:hypothetical protein F2P45_25465 [Massilia sp. CCM 8733]|uniref:Uncharacterized protein n=2 Tax=Massilia mucilaginosa TaxID=2609282 RepID=A0ABX0P055_9BURK|nr:hypothetical protein [Massilia mucilaginosa]
MTVEGIIEEDYAPQMIRHSFKLSSSTQGPLMTFLDMRNSLAGLTVADRLIRLRLWGDHGFLDDVMLVQDVEGVESIWGGIEYHLLCVSPTAGMTLKQFIAMPAELQFVTSSGTLRRVCGIVDCVQEGESDGGLGTYRLTMRDALSINDKGCNTRIFRDMNEVDITNVVLGDWCRDNPVLARAFQFQTWRLKSDYPRREFTFQRRESDSAFLRRLWKRRGFSWFFSPAVEAADGDAPVHVLM